jgi:molybdopterin molybdotransferase
MLPIDDAIAQMCQQAIPLTTSTKDLERVHLIAATGRILAEDIRSTIHVPPADNSAMDGYAINVDDLVQSTTLPISQVINAGHPPSPLVNGTAARIFTGAEIPMGANAVVMQEHCEVQCQASGESQANTVTLPSSVVLNNNIRLQGQDIHQGDIILTKGKYLHPQDIGLIASVGIAEVAVFRKLRVAILSTGDEITEPGKPLSAGKIYNTNRYLLHSLLQKMHIDVIDMGDITDTLTATTDAIEHTVTKQDAMGKAVDCIISTGGVSVGDEDHIKQAVLTLGELDFWRIAIKPGKPVAFGHIHDSQQHSKKHIPFIGLPGNPASVFVTFLLIARAFLLTLSHQKNTIPNGQFYTANFSWEANPKRHEYLRAQINPEGHIDIHPKQNSGILSSTAWANGLVVVPPQKNIHHGDTITFIPFNDFLSS